MAGFRPVMKHRLSIERKPLLGEDEYYEDIYGDWEVAHSSVPCLAFPDVRPVAVINAEVTEPDRRITRLFWHVLIGELDGDRATVELFSGDRIRSITDRRGNTVAQYPLNIIVIGRQYYGWRAMCEEHLPRFDRI